MYGVGRGCSRLGLLRYSLGTSGSTCLSALVSGGKASKARSTRGKNCLSTYYGVYTSTGRCLQYGHYVLGKLGYRHLSSAFYGEVADPFLTCTNNCSTRLRRSFVFKLAFASKLSPHDNCSS
ncbi:uncharacterized protein PgNI_02290 [Pyricularia grisea]|uniref:Uncharacterized protein n=1 Tax=Pyricularia grisea TaxID=148305 RepID=A0A6P8BJE2_PYRGI|nr:uncharacterized protein PgNI_02290 [Pyricularia grisea]TLD17016.1 hypothetical protein PgNI_02290 [Pyricularia grisea]